MTFIAKNEYYTIYVNQEKNRLYLTLIGFWKSRSAVPNYLEDLKKASNELSPGYTVLTDVTQLKTPPQDVVPLHLGAQKLVMADGSKKTAEVVGHDVTANMAFDRFSKESGMCKGTFDNKQEAEAWLDENA
jgi:hypothetical protein